MMPVSNIEKDESIFSEYWCELVGLGVITTGISDVEPKYHTIRAGKRFKVGDKFSPRVWGTDINPKSGRSGPYQSKQIIIAPDIEIKNVWSVEVKRSILNNQFNFLINGKRIFGSKLDIVARNDGLSLQDFDAWFEKPGKFQIICWDAKINY